MKERLFAYGTLLKNSVRKEVVGRAVKGSPDTLLNYRRGKIKIDEKTYPAISPTKKCFVRGVVFAVTTRELRRIDGYETKRYARIKLKLGKSGPAWVYVLRK